VKELKGFAKVSLRPGETKHISVPIDGRALSYYDEVDHKWRMENSAFDVLVGHSSAEIELRAKIELRAVPSASTASK